MKASIYLHIIGNDFSNWYIDAFHWDIPKFNGDIRIPIPGYNLPDDYQLPYTTSLLPLQRNGNDVIEVATGKIIWKSDDIEAAIAIEILKR